jgi:DNA polymerase/3'-5' exonuclease PolX
MPSKKTTTKITPSNQKNQLIIDQFNKLITQIKFQIDNAADKKEERIHQFRLQQMNKILKIIKNYPREIKSGDELKDMKGVGKGTIARIDEILKKGKLKELVGLSAQQKHVDVIDELEKIIGIGRKTANALVKEHKIKSIEQLKKKIDSGKIEVNDKVKLGLKYYGVVQQGIPRTEMMKMDKLILKEVKKVDLSLHGIICGSYRRQKLVSNDIDVLITHPDIKTKKDLANLKDKENHLKLLIKRLKKKGFLLDDMTDKNPESKYMGFCRLNKNTAVRRIDIRYVPYQSYYPALLYFTGSAEFNQKMRGLAVSLDYKLNEYGLYKVKDDELLKRIKVTSEEDIMNKLGMEYVEPQYR